MTYFDARALPQPSNEYVAWVDVMGIQSHMHRSINVTANFVFKLHVAALDAPRKDVKLYPIMDGLYVTSKTRIALEVFLRSVFSQYAKTFLNQSHMHFRFVIRGGIAYGAVYHGSDIGASGSKRLTENPQYKGAIVLGPPVVDAHQVEAAAPPFGLAVHPSARADAPTGDIPFPDDWWTWFGVGFDNAAFTAGLREYYRWCEKHSTTIGYGIDRIHHHESIALKYFA